MPLLVLDAPEDGGSSDVSMLSSEVSSFGGGISSLGSGGMGGRGVPPPSRDGSDAAGDGGGNMKLPGRKGGGGAGDAAMLVLNSGGCREGERGTSAAEGITSVSKGGATFCFALGDIGPNALAAKPDDRRETRVFRGLAALLFSFRGDFRAEVRGSAAGNGGGRMAGDGTEAPGAGVGGNSASIMSTCQARFSSNRFSRSACTNHHQFNLHS